MVAGEGFAPPPNQPFGEEGDVYVAKVVELFVNPSRREKLIRLLGCEAEGVVARRIWYGLTSHLDPSIVSDGMIFEARAVADLICAALIQDWVAENASKGRDGSQFGAGGDGVSKSIKLETLALHEKVAISDRDGVHLDSEQESAVDGSMGSCSVRGKSYKNFFADVGCLQVGTQAACKNASAIVDSRLMESGSQPVVAKGLDMGEPAVAKFACLGGAHAELAPVVVDPVAGGRPGVLDPAVGRAQNRELHLLQESLCSSSGEFGGSGALRCYQRVMGEDPLGSPQPVRGNASMDIDIASVWSRRGKGVENQSDRLGGDQAGLPIAGGTAQSHGLGTAHSASLGGAKLKIDGSKVLGNHGLGDSQPDCGNAVVVVVDERSQPSDFLSPAPGVGLNEWVRVAVDTRRGKKKKGSKSAVVVGKDQAGSVRCAAPDQLTSVDHFPLLSRLNAGRGDVRGNAGGSRSGDIAASAQGDLDKAVLNQVETTKFSWKKLLRSNKPTVLDIDLWVSGCQIPQHHRLCGISAASVRHQGGYRSFCTTSDSLLPRHQDWMPRHHFVWGCCPVLVKIR